MKLNKYNLKCQTIKVQCKLVVYVDAAFGKLYDRGIQYAYLIFLVNPDGKVNLISLKIIKWIVRSSFAAVTFATLDDISFVYCNVIKWIA